MTWGGNGFRSRQLSRLCPGEMDDLYFRIFPIFQAGIHVDLAVTGDPPLAERALGQGLKLLVYFFEHGLAPSTLGLQHLVYAAIGVFGFPAHGDLRFVPQTSEICAACGTKKFY